MRVLLDPRPTVVVARLSGLAVESVAETRRVHGWPSPGPVRQAVQSLLQSVKEERQYCAARTDCPLCGREVSKRRLHRHQGTDKCLRAVAAIALAAGQELEPEPGSRLSVCPDCGRAYEQLGKHQGTARCREPARLPRVVCPLCDTEVAAVRLAQHQGSAYCQHRQQLQAGREPIVCPDCGRSFKAPGAFGTHRGSASCQSNAASSSASAAPTPPFVGAGSFNAAAGDRPSSIRSLQERLSNVI